MSEYKNQHFVPQFYFRQFTEGERINLHNIGASINASEPIKNVCSRDYFYSENTDIEKSFSKIEGKWAEIIGEVEQQKSLKTLSEQDRLFFRWFILFQELRTRKKTEELQEMVDDLAASVFENVNPPDMPEDKSIGEMFEQGEVTIENHKTQLQALYKSFSRILLLNDLEYVFVRNRTDENFIFSDHPVIFHNSAYCSIDYKGVCGYQSRGLQIFCPISPDLAVIYYDPITYRVKRDEDNIVEADIRDVKDLNRLQALKADNNLFFTDGFDAGLAEEYVSEMSNHRDDEGVTVKKYSTANKKENSEIIHHYRSIADFSPEFSFMIAMDKFPFYAPRSIELLEKSRQLDDWAEEDLIGEDNDKIE
jgi:hypothetical protein